jgi:hypothetical protein
MESKPGEVAQWSENINRSKAGHALLLLTLYGGRRLIST